MKTKEISVEKVGILAGALECLAFIAYFMLMKYLNLVDIAELRWLNLLIQLGGIILALRYYHRKTQVRIDYLNGMALCFLTSIVGAFLFSIFIFVFFSTIDPLLLQLLKDNTPMMGKYLTPFSAAITVLTEGTVSALVFSYVVMQYYKDDPNTVKEDDTINSDRM